jgi:hypothetical protein
MINFLINAVSCLYRTMDRMAVNNEKDFAFALPEQTSNKLQEDINPKSLFEHHKIELNFICNSRCYIAAKALACSRNYQRLTMKSIGTSYRVIRAQPHLITPVNTGFFNSGLSLDDGIVFLQPMTHRFWVFLKRPINWFLKGKATTRKKAAQSPDRKPDRHSS